jgi:hypothetical protein
VRKIGVPIVLRVQSSTFSAISERVLRELLGGYHIIKMLEFRMLHIMSTDKKMLGRKTYQCFSYQAAGDQLYVGVTKGNHSQN